MRRYVLWIILGGVIIVSAVVLAELIGTIVYLRSPEKAVAGAFEKLIDAKSVSFNITADRAKDLVTASAAGSLDKSSPTAPELIADFSYSAENHYSVKGSLVASAGQVFVKFSDTVGLPPELARSFGSAWVGAAVNTLYLIAEDDFISLRSNLTDSDLAAIASALNGNLPLRAAGKGQDEMLENTYVVRYPVVFDRSAAVAFTNNLRGLLKDQKVSDEKFGQIVAALNAVQDFGGDVWIAKTDGTLRAARFAVPFGAGDNLNVLASFSDYDKKVEATAPERFLPAADLFRGLYAPTLGAAPSADLSATPYGPAVQTLVNPPAVDLKKSAGLELNAAADTNGGGGLMDAILRFFYGSNPFSGNGGNKNSRGNIFNVNTGK
jgi:hypothetical protein